MSRWHWVCLVLLVLMLAGCVSVAPSSRETSLHRAPVVPVEVVARWPHDQAAFTQGLVFADGGLYESTGLVGESSIRRVELATGTVRQQVLLPAPLFGEGIAVVGDRLVQLTWKSGVAYVYDRATLERQAVLTFAGEGWGLAFDGVRLIQSDGTATLRFRDPQTFAELEHLEVRDGDQPVTRLNELEVIGGAIYANVWGAERLAVIDPATGLVQRWLDLSGLRDVSAQASAENVLNGIAYDAVNQRLFVTGKRWSTVFEIAEDARRDDTASQ